jgi:L-gulonate 5-dehydrogenase
MGSGMQSLVFDAPRAARLADLDRPRRGPDEALIRLTAAGLCAGDLSIYTGKNPYVTYPRIGGHEIAGVVVESPQGAAMPGTRVVVDPFIGCGRCYPCRVGRRNCCAALTIIGAHRDGGFADYVVAPAGNLHAVPESLGDFEAAFVEPVAIGVQACRRADITGDDMILVLGAGPIGLAVIEVARVRGAKVYATDISGERLATAAELGATPVEGGPGLKDRVLALTNGEGMPVVVEATGATAAMEMTLELVASAGRIVILGLLKAGVGITVPGLDLTRKEVTIFGSRASLDCFPEALALLAGSHIRYPRLATRFPLRQAPDVFARLAADPMALHKAVFVWEAQ